MVGASGAIAGVLGAYLLLYPNANVLCIIIYFIVNIPAWILLSFWFAMQLLSGLARSPGTPGVAFWAHVGGFVSGIILVTLLRPRGVALMQPRHSRGLCSGTAAAHLLAAGHFTAVRFLQLADPTVGGRGSGTELGAEPQVAQLSQAKRAIFRPAFGFS